MSRILDFTVYTPRPLSSHNVVIIVAGYMKGRIIVVCFALSRESVSESMLAPNRRTYERTHGCISCRDNYVRKLETKDTA